MFPDATIEKIESSGGRFEIVVDGELVYSKASTGDFPRYQQLPGLIMEASAR